jgi:predicted nucleic acid-binding protein
VIFLDANIFMYVAGAAHPHKEASTELLRRVVAGEVLATTSAEVLQEILHRYRALGRWPEGKTVFRLACEIVPDAEPLTVRTLVAAADLLDRYAQLTARDALHAATCLSRGARLCSYDRDFDGIAGLERVTPEEVLAALRRPS